ncbi:MAG TPA: ATP-binding protein [Gammaproteobacteria bacterium]|nr:ATP-binding protein [Gammaproteobacteria bacterium]
MNKADRISPSSEAPPGATGGEEQEIGRLIAELRKFDALISAVSDFVYTFDLNHRFTYANRALLAIWGGTWEESIGKTCLELGYPDWHAAMHDREIDEVIATKRSIRGEVPFEGANGRRIYEYIFVPILDADGEVEAIGGITRDVTDRKRKEEGGNFLVALSDAIRSITDAAEILEVVSRMLGSHLGAGRCGYGELDKFDNFTVERDWTDGRMPTLVGTLNLRDFGDIADEFRAGRTVRIGYAPDEALTHNAKASYSDARETVSGIGVPLIKGGRLVAVLFVHQRKPRAWTDEEVALVKEVAERTWEAVERARVEAELHAANRAKDEFLAMLGHELRNPLAPISTALQLMRLREPDALVRERTIIESQVRHLTDMVDDLLDVSRIARGRIELKQAPANIRDIVAQSLETTAPLLEKREQRVETDIEESLTVEGDARRLVQVVTNLLTNAAKYSPPRQEIRVSGRAEDGEAVLRVRDDGIGIEAELLPHVFDLFTQSAQSIERAEGGLGLGLALVRNIVMLHGGRVEALSDGRDRGSEFIVRLPLLNAHPAQSGRDATVEEMSPAAPTTGLKILIVDDYVDAADSIAELLQMAGYETRVAYDGVAALEAAAEFKPAVALIDIGLPVMDGYEVARRLRETPGLERLSLVALTGYGQESDRQRAREAGFLEHVVKPIDPLRLGSLIEEVAANNGKP